MSSYRPPLPPGPPPTRYVTRSTDSYRPPRDDYLPQNFNGEPMYQFRGQQSQHYYGQGHGAHEYGYHPGRSPPRGPASNYGPSNYGPSNYGPSNYGPSNYGPDNYAHGNYAPGISPPRGPSGDAYRPPGGGFNFQYDAPPSMNFGQADSYRPASPPRRYDSQMNSSSSFNGDRHGDHRPARRGGRGGTYRGRGSLPRLASDRAFLKGNRAPTPELMQGMGDEDSHVVKFKAVDEMSDSDEAEMNMSEEDQPKKKQVRLETKAADSDSVPRWSNPDPYTALPPPDESQRKKKDVVKLIRKARVMTSLDTVKTPAATDDFISFGFGEDEDDDKEPEPTEPPRTVVPTGPRSNRVYNSQQQHVEALPEALVVKDLNIQARDTQSKGNAKETVGFSGLNSPSDPALGNRKRTIRDEIKGPPLIHKQTKGRPQAKVNGAILREWNESADFTGTPWLGIDHSDTANMGVWLHKEIVDWYNFVKPRKFEQHIREKLIEDLRSRIGAFHPDADIRPFGSFPAGLYLPTADMDLVCVTNNFIRTGRRTLGVNPKRDLRNFEKFLRAQGLALPDSIQFIPSAKVPLIKYVDKITGLRVDISFENNTGLVANNTFQEWKVQFPAMPILVTLIKHLLAMRGLNEPVNGGIGGFSVTCLVTSLLQNMPEVQSRSLVPEHHLGQILMEFLDLYGKQFNTRTTAIRLNPPGYVSKTHIQSIVYNNKNPSADKFSIIDPNRRENDIAGGSSNTPTIRKCFSNTYDLLQKRMGELQYSDSTKRREESVLSCVLAGNYSSFDLQRQHLAHLYEKLFGQIDDVDE
ncbi:hypothetical protein B7494_g4939 [Chlorociboria aeruginascens]|nr:hypothetical protein B7494_g4939 [Chlorociboria aeruginascens]